VSGGTVCAPRFPPRIERKGYVASVVSSCGKRSSSPCVWRPITTGVPRPAAPKRRGQPARAEVKQPRVFGRRRSPYFLVGVPDGIGVRSADTRIRFPWDKFRNRAQPGPASPRVYIPLEKVARAVTAREFAKRSPRYLAFPYGSPPAAVSTEFMLPAWWRKEADGGPGPTRAFDRDMIRGQSRSAGPEAVRRD